MSRSYNLIPRSAVCSVSFVNPFPRSIPSVLGLRIVTVFLFAATVTCVALWTQCAPAQTPAADGSAQQISDIERRLNNLNDALTETQRALQQSREEIKRLHEELDAVRAQEKAAPPILPMQPVPPEEKPVDSASVETEIQALHEQQEILQAEIKQHEQIKVETASKYSLRVTGLALFNAFSNAGVVDDAELPALALPRPAGTSHGSVGATLRQTIFGVEASGPVIGGARSSASVNVDFFGGETTNAYGYTSGAGVVRMRDAQVSLDWDESTLQLGYTVPLISPRSPTSYATVAQPALAGSGNLWTWSPQIRFEQRLPLHDQEGFSMEGGLTFPASPSYSSVQSDSPVEASRRPGVEGRVAFHSDLSPFAPTRSLVFGVSAYKAYQYYNSSTHLNSYAIAADWQIPISRWVDFSGEFYRGRSIGGLGGGLYKDIIVGHDYKTGLSRTVGVDAAGGWSQLKLNLNSRFEANAMFGLDNAFSSNFDSVVLAPSSDPIATTVRNNTVGGNLIFRPRSSLIFSPEYRRVNTWRYTGPMSVANIFILSAGYQF